MTITPTIRIADRKLVVKDRTILTGVPDNVTTTTGSTTGPIEGMFVGAVFDEEKSQHVVPLGSLKDVRFMACFRFKLWWMAQKMGDKGSEIPLETQFLLLETKDGSLIESEGGDESNQVIYTVFLPLIEGPFRTCLQGNAQDQLELCFDSGDSETKTASFNRSLYISSGADPFSTISEAITAVKLHLKTFKQRHEKKLPPIVDYFGWCTWDAFYQEVTQEGVEAGLESLKAIGCPPKFVIIDDGWQSVGGDPNEQKPLMRLTGIKENSKFQKKDDPTTALVRASDDFFPRDPVSHTIHIAAVAYNSVFLGDFMQPDWDMFHSLHPAAEYHASARAISGGPVYVSLLKIWNMNKYTGVLGVYNCQGAAWNSIERKNTFHPTQSGAITGTIRGRDVHLIADATTDTATWNGDCAIYSHRSASLLTLPYNAALPVSLKVLEHEVFTITPVRVLANGRNFAPLGLIDMFNAGGAIEDLKYEEKSENGDALVKIEVKGCGRFGVYSSVKPRKCVVDLVDVEFEYDLGTGMVVARLEGMPEETMRVHVVQVEL
ncbi:Glycosyl hydrolases 36 [Dillenia turbinata]|uniref:galactinol--sucrose galactosyltransferase n=1 Tax=Dillenia turbinata TaxID=194707 RepID=A0AAN8VVH2_9MAGN